MKKRVLILLPYIPYPLDCGGNEAIFNTINGVRDGVEISVLLDVQSHGILHKVSSKRMTNVEALKQHWPNVKFYLYTGENKETPQKCRTSWYCKFLAVLQNVISRKSNRENVRWNIRSSKGDVVRAMSQISKYQPAYHDSFLSYVRDVASKGFDIIQVEMYEYLYLGYILPRNVRRIFVHHELRFVRTQNEMNLFRECNPMDELNYQIGKAVELAALKQYDEILTLTDTDRNVLANLLPGVRVVTSPIAVCSRADMFPSFIPAQDFVFMGSSAHFPNLDALRWFATEILPLLHEYGMPCKVYVVGKWSKIFRKELESFCPEIVFMGFVQDLSTFINGKISIVPLRIGSGIRIKILDAVKYGSPVIATSKGNEGLLFRHNQECLIADTADDFAKAMLWLVQDTMLQSQLTTNAQAMFQKEYSQQRVCDVRLEIYNKTVNKISNGHHINSKGK